MEKGKGMKAREYELLKKAAEKVVDYFAQNPNTKQRAVTKITKLVLLRGPYLIHGRFWDVKAKNLGAGVYELSLIEKSPK